MAQRTPNLEGIGIVLVGNLNPAIFQPWWFAKHGLVRDSEADSAEIEVVHPDLSSLNFEGYSVVVTEEKFQVTTVEEPYYPVIRDLVVGTFRLLSHTPIRYLGINLEAHYHLGSEATWHAFGHLLAPKAPWDGLLVKPGMRNLLMEGSRPDDTKGCIRVTVQPSVRFHPGLFFKVNDHFEFEAETRAGSVTTRLENAWQESITRSRQIFQRLLEQVPQ